MSAEVGVARGVVGGLPADMTSFVGRRHATAEVKRALSKARLVTLTGVGGVGKSRLALHVAREVRRAFPDGAWLVELAKLGDPALVEHTVAAALELPDQSSRDPATVLAEFLADKHLLLILDNCEHVLERCGRLVDRLLTAALTLSVLATSREPLGIIGERLWSVPPLTVPSDDDGGKVPAQPYEALALFKDRAGAVVPDFTLSKDNELAVARLCRRLDGLPLAIELAAVRMRVLSVEQILARLEDRFTLLTGGSRGAAPRHQTLRAAVEWSFELCSEPERLLWARCSIFAGDFDLAAAESVCAGPGLAADEVLDAITGLVDKSILTRQEHGLTVRYRILETIRQYGRARLDEAGETPSLRRRHRDYYLQLAEQADEGSCGPRQYEWGERLQAERANLWAALDYCLTVPGQERHGLRLGTALWFYWFVCGFVRDGRHWLDRALKAAPVPSRERAKALWLDGWVAIVQGDISDAMALLRECHDLARALDDPVALTHAIQHIGAAELARNNLPRAVSLLDEALARHRERDSWTAPALIVFPHRVTAAAMLGDTERALSLSAEGEAVCSRLGERWVRSSTLWGLGLAWWVAGDYGKARTQFREALRQKLDIQDQLGTPFCVELLAWVATAEDDPHRAAVLFGAAEKLWEPIGAPLFGYQILLSWRAQNLAATRAALGDRAFEAAHREGASLTPDTLAAHVFGTKPPVPPARDTAPTPVLTKREREVATLIARGLQNKDIAAELVISQRTAETHVENILTKLGFTSRTQIAAWLSREDSRRSRWYDGHDGMKA